MLRRLDETEALELLRSVRTGHLGCVLPNGSPYVLPVNYICRDGNVYIHSLPGKKLAALRENPSVCIQAEQIKSPYRWQSVIAYGLFEEVENPLEREALIEEMLEGYSTLTPVEGIAAGRGSDRDVVVFRIRIESVTAVAES